MTGPTSALAALAQDASVQQLAARIASILQVSSEQKLWRVNFTADTQPNAADWTLTGDTGDGHIINRGGDSSGASYLRISLNPLVESSQIQVHSKSTFAMPVRVGVGFSQSQRVIGQEVFVGMLADDGAGGIDTAATPVVADLALPASITIATNVATIVLAGHGLKGADRVNLIGCPDSRLNVGPVVVTVSDVNTITVPITLANGTYNSTGGTLRYADPMRYAANGAGYLHENAAPTNASAVMRRNGRKFRSLNIAIASSAAVQSNASPFTDAFNAAAQHELDLSMEEVRWRALPADSGAAPSGVTKWTQGLPSEDALYRLVIRARNLAGMTRPVARIVSIAKTGTSTCTVTTDVAHGLTVADWAQVYGVADQVNFPNLTAQTQIASVIDATHFTIVMGPGTTASSIGGTVVRVQGSQLFTPAGANVSVASVACVTPGILTLTLSGASAVPLPGEYWQVHGLQGGQSALDGGYKVLRMSGGTLELDAPGLTAFGSVATGGAIFKRTDVRVHFTRVDDFNRVAVEVVGGRGNGTDQNNAVPVAVTNAGYAVNQGTGSAVVTSVWQAGAPSGTGFVDAAAAALTVTTTTAAITPGGLANVGHGAYVAQVAVTAVSGAGATLDVVIQESPDAGTNWKDVYHFERITAAGSYTSPLLRLQEGSQIRYVQTVAGTTPSFTRSIRRNVFNLNAPMLRRFFDRATVNLNTLNSATPTYDVKGADTVQIVAQVGAITTTPPQLVVEGSEDGANWYQLSATPLAAVASSTVQQTILGLLASFVRARVSTAGVGVTPGYVAVKAIGR